MIKKLENLLKKIFKSEKIEYKKDTIVKDLEALSEDILSSIDNDEYLVTKKIESGPNYSVKNKTPEFRVIKTYESFDKFKTLKSYETDYDMLHFGIGKLSVDQENNCNFKVSREITSMGDKKYNENFYGNAEYEDGEYGEGFEYDNFEHDDDDREQYSSKEYGYKYDDDLDDFFDLGELLKSDSFKKELEEYDLENSTYKQNKDMIQSYQETRDANILGKIVEENQKLVLKYVAQYRRFLGFLTLEEDDLIIFGNIGLMKAINKFDPDRGSEFSTYATYWIRQAIVRGIYEEGNTVRLPVYIHTDINSLNRLKRDTFESDDEALSKKVCTELGWDQQKYERINFYSNTFRTISSFDIGINTDDGSDSTIGQFLAPNNNIYASDVPSIENNFEEYIVQKDTVDRIIGLIEEYDDRTADIMKRRLGLVNGRIYTLEELGQIHGVTRERIRQIQSKTLKSLRRKIKLMKIS